MASVATPTNWAYLRIGEPLAMATVASLGPAGIGARSVRSRSGRGMPDGRSARATTTLSASCRRRYGACMAPLYRARHRHARDAMRERAPHAIDYRNGNGLLDFNDSCRATDEARAAQDSPAARAAATMASSLSRCDPAQ